MHGLESLVLVRVLCCGWGVVFLLAVSFVIFPLPLLFVSFRLFALLLSFITLLFVCRLGGEGGEGSSSQICDQICGAAS